MYPSTTRCPSCEVEIDARLLLNGCEMTEGDPAICFTCGEPMIYTGVGFVYRKMTTADRDFLRREYPDTLEALDVALARLRESRATTSEQVN